MYIIVGLGNPTREYVGTRHNIGFEAVDAAEYGIRVMEKKDKAMIGKGGTCEACRLGSGGLCVGTFE